MSAMIVFFLIIGRKNGEGLVLLYRNFLFNTILYVQSRRRGQRFNGLRKDGGRDAQAGDEHLTATGADPHSGIEPGGISHFRIEKRTGTKYVKLL